MYLCKVYQYVLYKLKKSHGKFVMNVQEAVANAKTALVDLFASEDPRGIRLEEVVLDDSSNWKITLSYARQAGLENGDNMLASVINSMNVKRAYKVVTIDKSTGEVKAIKIRDDI